MNKFVCFLLFAFSSSAFAQGNLSVRYSLLNQSSDSYFRSAPEFGLWINEPIDNIVEFQSWTGYNVNRWLVSEAYILKPIMNNRVKFGIGPAYSTNIRTGEVAADVKVMLEVKLWN